MESMLDCRDSVSLYKLYFTQSMKYEYYLHFSVASFTLVYSFYTSISCWARFLSYSSSVS